MQCLDAMLGVISGITRGCNASYGYNTLQCWRKESIVLWIHCMRIHTVANTHAHIHTNTITSLDICSIENWWECNKVLNIRTCINGHDVTPADTSMLLSSEARNQHHMQAMPQVPLLAVGCISYLHLRPICIYLYISSTVCIYLWSVLHMCSNGWASCHASSSNSSSKGCQRSPAVTAAAWSRWLVIDN